VIPAYVQTVLDRATARLRDVTRAGPIAAAQAPGRVNLIGEHTDYSGGFVMPMAIDRVCVAVAAAGERMFRVVFADQAGEVAFDPGPFLEPNPAKEKGTPVGYVRGVVRGFQDLAPVPPLTVAVASSVPLGGGLSSSASFEVALATLLSRVMGLGLGPERLAMIAHRAEQQFAGVPCGIMDQFVSAGAAAGHAMLLDCARATPTHVPMPKDALVAVIDTGVRHALASGAYAERRRWCEAAAAGLGVPTLRAWFDRAERVLPAGLAEGPARAVAHVVSENQRTLDAAVALRSGDLVRVGAFMDASHASLRDVYGVSCVELDAATEIARGVPGVYGARMTGAGFGGCAVALCAPEAAETLGRVLDEAYHARTGRRHVLFITRAIDGAGAIG
jgi:galactokinase